MAKKTKNTDPPKTREQATNAPGGVSQPPANPEDTAKRIKALLRNRQNYFNALQETNKDSDNESNRIGLEETDNLLTNLGVNTEEVNTYQKHIYDNRDKIDNYKEIASGSDSLVENLFEFVDPTGISSWDDVRRAQAGVQTRRLEGGEEEYQTIINPLDYTAGEATDILGALPRFGNKIKVANKGFKLTKKAAENTINNLNAANKVIDGISVVDGATDVYEDNVKYDNGGKITKTRTKKDGTVVQGSQGVTGTQPVNMEGWSRAERGPGSPDPNAGWDTEQPGQELYRPESPSPPGVVETIKNAIVSTNRDLLSSLGVPANKLAFAQNLIGDTTPITESFYDQEELDAMYDLIEDAISKGQDPSKGAVDYPNYPDKENVYKQEDMDAYQTPTSIARTTLGQFSYKLDDDGNYIINDAYNFNPSKLDAHHLGEYTKKELKEMSRSELFEKGKEYYESKGENPTQVQYLAARHWLAPYKQGDDIPVNITLPPRNKKLADGGSLSADPKKGDIKNSKLTEEETTTVRDAIRKAAGENANQWQLNDLYENVFADEDSVEKTRALISSGTLGDTANTVLGSGLAQSVLSGEKPGFGDILSSLGSAKGDIHKTLINMGVSPEDAVEYIKDQARQLGAPEENLGYIDRLGGKGWANPLNFFNYELPESKEDGGPFKTTPPAGPREDVMTDAEMSLKILQEANAGNPAARRMRSDTGQQMFLPGETDPSTHYMASMDNYAVPLVQEEYIGGPLNYNDNPPPSSSDFKFDSDDKANYFAKKYKNASAAKVFNEDGGLLPTLMNKRRRPQGILPTMMKTGGKMHRMPNGKMMLNSEHPPTEKYATGGVIGSGALDSGLGGGALGKKGAWGGIADLFKEGGELPTFEGDHKKKDYTSSQNGVEDGENPPYKVDENGAWKYNERTNTYMPQTPKQVYSWGKDAEGSAYWQAPGTGHTSAKERSMVQQGIQDAMDAKDWDLLSTYVSPTHTQASTRISGLTPAVTGDKTATPLDERTNALNAEINAAQNAQNNVLPINTPPAEYAQGGQITDPPKKKKQTEEGDMGGAMTHDYRLSVPGNPMGIDTINDAYVDETTIMQIRNNQRAIDGKPLHINYDGDIAPPPPPANTLPGTPAAAAPTYEEAMQMRSYRNGGRMQVLPSFITPAVQDRGPSGKPRKFETGGFGVGEPQTSGFQNANLDTGQQAQIIEPTELTTELPVDATQVVEEDKFNLNDIQTGGAVSAATNQIIDNNWDDPIHGVSKGKETVMKANSRGEQFAMIGGSIVPGWGHLIGGAVGLVTGAVEGSTGAETTNKAYQKQFDEDYAKLQAADDERTMFARDGGYLKNGGKVPSQYNEGYMNDTYNEYNGNKHEQGGILIGQDSEVETGEVRWNDYIFSDSLQPSNKFKV